MSEWISVKDRLPEESDDVLAYTIWDDIVVCFLEEDSDVWMHTWGYLEKEFVTHWMPIPEPPIENL